jgi:hypothetical protein
MDESGEDADILFGAGGKTFHRDGPLEVPVRHRKNKPPAPSRNQSTISRNGLGLGVEYE